MGDHNKNSSLDKRVAARHRRKRQLCISDFMYKSGWTPISNYKHGGNIMLSSREAGGGGDCMFHSLAAVMADGRNFQDMRNLASGLVTPQNAPDILRDMSAQCPKTVADKMDELNEYGYQQFAPDRAWNLCKGDANSMSLLLKTAIITPGNLLWGDATLAALLEDGLGVNIVLLAVDAGINVPCTRRETIMARDIYARWVDALLRYNPELMNVEDTQIVNLLIPYGCTIKAAKDVARKLLGINNGFLKGRRQPLGTVRMMCSEMQNQSVNISLLGYRDDRPTVIIWNRGNTHWIPVAVGPNYETVIQPDSPLRQYVDSLIR